MFETQFISPEIQSASLKESRFFLTANIVKPVQLFQAQRATIKTGVAIQSDQLVFAVPTTENNHMGLIPGSGIELLECTGGEVELLLWNRNVPGQQRMITIEPGMVLAELVVMPRYNLEKKPSASASSGKDDKPGPSKSPARPKKADANPGKAA